MAEREELRLRLSHDLYYACTGCGKEHMKLLGDHCSTECKKERDSNVSAYRRIYAEHNEELQGRARVRNERGRKNRQAALHAADD